MKMTLMKSPRRMVTLALILAVLAVLLILLHRSREFREIAIAHEQELSRPQWRNLRIGQSDLKIDQLNWKTRADFHRAMGSKYRYAARHPWLPVEPDSQQPQ